MTELWMSSQEKYLKSNIARRCEISYEMHMTHAFFLHLPNWRPLLATVQKKHLQRDSLFTWGIFLFFIIVISFFFMKTFYRDEENNETSIIAYYTAPSCQEIGRMRKRRIIDASISLIEWALNFSRKYEI